MHIGRGVLPLLACLAGGPAGAQSVISARAGLVYHTEGRAFLNTRPLQSVFGLFPQMKNGDMFRTGRGRAEILLAPGVFLRLGERTSMQLVSDSITQAKVELVSGRAVLDVASLRKAETVAFGLLGATVSISKRGLYHLETNPPSLRVFRGKVLVLSGDRRIEIGQGQMLQLEGTWTAQGFDRSRADALDAWSDGRSRELAYAEPAAVSRQSERREEDRFSAETTLSDRLPGAGLGPDRQTSGVNRGPRR